MKDDLVPGQLPPGGREQLEAALKNYGDKGLVWGVTVDCGPDGCNGAMAIDGQAFPLNAPPSLPRPGCNRSPCCSCTYLPVLDDEAPALANPAAVAPTTPEARKPMTRTKKYVLALVGVAVVSGIVAEQSRPPPDPAATARAALALTAAKKIKAAAKDPGSIEFISMNVNTGATAACAEYRGRNSFNAKITQFTVFVGGVGITDDAKAWNKHCTAGMHDHGALVR